VALENPVPGITFSEGKKCLFDVALDFSPTKRVVNTLGVVNASCAVFA
jgi:hypothetical protein